LRLVFVGYNPGLESARLGRYYAHPGNAFWRHLNASGLVPEPVSHLDDERLADLAGIGFTDLCPRPTLRAGELSPVERREGARRLVAEIDAHAPLAAVFSGKDLYREVLRHGLGDERASLRPWGLQPERLAGGLTAAWVIPSSSGLASRWHGERLRLLRDIAAAYPLN
jgi:TDG/mug DNA glycosylase family protein